MQSGAIIAGRYRLVELVGAGSMGHVWRARDERLQREVAVKVVDLVEATGPVSADQFRREVVAAAQLSHPNIVTTFDGGTDRHLAYLVMELVPGQSLAERLRRGPLLPDDALRVGMLVGRALDATHQIGVVHRDVKPGNVMLTPSGGVKVLDFGIAGLVGDPDVTSQDVVGTAAYMSPEQARGRLVGPPSDVYALGCLLVAMLAGRPPFVGATAVEVASQQINVPAPDLRTLRPDAPAALARLVASMLAKDPATRPDAAAVVRELAALRPGAAAASAAASGTFPAAGVGAGAASLAASPQADAFQPDATLPDAAATDATITRPPAAQGAGGTAVLPPGGTAVLPPSGPSSFAPPAADPYSSGVTAQLPSGYPPAGYPAQPGYPGQAPHQTSGYPPVTPRTYQPGPVYPATRAGTTEAAPPWFRRGVTWILLAMLALVILAAVALGGSKLLDGLFGGGPASPSTRPTSSTTRTTTATKTPTVPAIPTMPTMPTITLPTIPSPGDLALEAAVNGVTSALDAWDPSSEDAARSKQQLTSQWAGASEAILADKDAAAELSSFQAQVDLAHGVGDMPTGVYATVMLALQGVALLI